MCLFYVPEHYIMSVWKGSRCITPCIPHASNFFRLSHRLLFLRACRKIKLSGSFGCTCRLHFQGDWIRFRWVKLLEEWHMLINCGHNPCNLPKHRNNFFLLHGGRTRKASTWDFQFILKYFWWYENYVIKPEVYTKYVPRDRSWCLRDRCWNT